MNRKGFTLVELLAVIVLLGVIGGIAFASVRGIYGSINENMLDKKVEIIEEAAKLYGDNIKGTIINSTKKYNGHPCMAIKVSDLVNEKYLEKDNDNACLTSSSISSVGCVVNPSDKDKYLDTNKVIIYYKNKRIQAKVDLNNNLTCN